jgi:hypothetical protein
MRILLFVVLTVLVLAKSPPVFPNQYTLEFNETAKIITSRHTGNTTGVIYFDATNNRETITR